jgi:hypothetical protein
VQGRKSIGIPLEKFVTSGSGCGVLKIQFWSGVGFRVRKFPKKPGFGFRFGLGFVKNIKTPAV